MAKTSRSKTQPSLEDLQKEINTLDENWKRALADYHNLLRRVEADKKEFVKMSNANLIARLLPSLDIIEMAATHSQDLGVQMAAKQFNQTLMEEGLQIIDPKPGDAFDARFHECIETLELAENTTPNTVAETSLKGYKMGEYILRPAKVKVYNQSQSST